MLSDPLGWRYSSWAVAGLPGHWAPSHRLGCSSQPPRKSLVSPPLTASVCDQHAYSSLVITPQASGLFKSPVQTMIELQSPEEKEMNDFVDTLQHWHFQPANPNPNPKPLPG